MINFDSGNDSLTTFSEKDVKVTKVDVDDSIDQVITFKFDDEEIRATSYENAVEKFLYGKDINDYHFTQVNF